MQNSQIFQNQYQAITSVEALEAIIGKIPAMARMKPIKKLDSNCTQILSLASIAGLGFHTSFGPRTILIGGAIGFAKIISPTELTFTIEEMLILVEKGASLLFIIAGVGEVLRINGTLKVQNGNATFHVLEAYIHCARAILRSGLWSMPYVNTTPTTPREFIEASPFLLLSSWGVGGSSDTSPRGDSPPIMKLLDKDTFVLPDRLGNHRTDTLHNVMIDNNVSFLAIIPGSNSVLEVVAKVKVVADESLLKSLSIGSSIPQTAMIFSFEKSNIYQSNVLQKANIWDKNNHLSKTEAPNMIALGAAMMANKKKWLGFVLSPLLKFLNYATKSFISKKYNNDLQNEGYQKTIMAKIVSIVHETADAVSLLLKNDTKEDFVFKAGQFFAVSTFINGKMVRRNYSASSAPSNQLRITIKNTGGVFSTWAKMVAKTGDILTLTGPSGIFFIENHKKQERNLVLIAAGSGITPMMSIANATLQLEPKTNITLLNGNRQQSDIIFKDELEQLEKSNPNKLKVRHILSRPTTDWVGSVGRLDEIGLPKELSAIKINAETVYFVCGPEIMIKSVLSALASLNINEKNIYTELFTPPKLPEGASQTLIMKVLDGKLEKSVNIDAGKTLLEAGNEAGLSMAYSCGSGVCGECKIKLCAGKVIMAEPNCLTETDRKANLILACVAKPLTRTF